MHPTHGEVVAERHQHVPDHGEFRNDFGILVAELASELVGGVVGIGSGFGLIDLMDCGLRAAMQPSGNTARTFAVPWISCRYRHEIHRLGNIRAKLADDTAPAVMAEIRAIGDAPSLEAAHAQAVRVINRCRRASPTAVTCLEDDPDALLAVHRISVRHRVNVRTFSLVE